MPPVAKRSGVRLRIGRTILTIYAGLSHRAEFQVLWEEMDRTEFLHTLTRELSNPGKAIMDELVLRHTRLGVMSVSKTATRLSSSFNRA